MKNYKIIFLLLLQVVGVCAYSQTTEITFEVFLKNKSIGQIKAIETKAGTKIIRDVKSESSAHVLAFSIHVETDTKVTNENKVLVEGIAYRHANHGAKEIQATTKRINFKKYERERNGVKSLFEQDEIKFCVADLFFEQPLGLQKVYSNMFAEMLTVKDLGNGKYQVTNPEKKITTYTYSSGNLRMVESETPGGTVVSKRK